MTKQGKARLAVCLLVAGGISGQVFAATMLDPVYVYGERSRDITQGGYTATSQHLGVLGDKSVMDTPFSQVNLTNKTLSTYADASQPSVSPLVNVPSIRTSSSTLYNDFSIRGQSANSYQFRVNGMPSVFTQMNLGIHFVERIDVTSGPSMGIQGASKASPGGVINLISKRAEKDQTNVTLSFAGKSSIGVQVDAGGRFGEQREVGVRVNGEYVSGDTAIKGDKRTNKDIYVNLDYKGNTSNTNLLLGYRDTISEGGQRYFNFQTAKLNSMPKAPDASNNYSFKGQKLGIKNKIAILNHEQQLSDKLVAFMTAGYSKTDGYDYVMSLFSRVDVRNAAGDFERELFSGPYSITSKYFQAGVRGEFNTGNIRHEWSLAADRSWYNDAWGETGTPKRFMKGNLYTVGISIDGLPTVGKPRVPSKKTTFTGVGLIDVMSYGDFQFMVGVHRQSAKVVAQSTGKEVNSHATSPLLGLVYRPNDNWSYYASHAESFEQGTVVGSQYENKNDILPPAKMKSNEYGVKYQKAGMLAALAYFDMERASNIEVMRNCKPYLLQDGRATYRGWEGSVNGSLSEKWSYQVGFMYMDAKQKKTKNGEMDGRRVVGVADWSATVGAEYHANDNLDFMGRMVYVGDAVLLEADKKDITIPSNVTFDFGARYRTLIGGNEVTFRAMVFNVFNKNYWIARPGYNYGILNNPRTFSVSASWQF